MEQKMITLATEIQFSKERLSKIFEVPKTKELFEKFLSKKENKEKISELEEKLSEALSEEDMLQFVPKEEIQKELKVFILSDSLETVVNGKSLNQAIQTNIRKQIEEPVAIEKVEEHIEGLLLNLEARVVLQDLLKLMLS